jgi:hypothetical protein
MKTQDIKYRMQDTGCKMKGSGCGDFTTKLTKGAKEIVMSRRMKGSAALACNQIPKIES